MDSENDNGDINPGEGRAIVANNGSAFLQLQKRQNVRSKNSAKQIRESLKNYLNGPGAVSWQLAHVRATHVE